MFKCVTCHKELQDDKRHTKPGRARARCTNCSFVIIRDRLLDAPIGWCDNYKKYGLTRDSFSNLVKNQQGLCAICKSSGGSKTWLVVDHNHITNKVRGLLCHSCNVGLGHFKENPLMLKAAMDYLGTNLH